MKISKEEYEKWHTNKLVKTKWKVDVELLEEEISMLPFYRWGDTHTMRESATPLVNNTGVFSDDDESIGPLDRLNFLKEFPHWKNCEWTDDHVKDWKEWWSRDHDIDNYINERHFSIPTPGLDISSLNVIDDLKPFLFRSCILKWNYMGHFHEHVDTWHPTQWFRLWGTTKPDGMVIRFEGTNYDEEIEAGRLYLIDTTLKHEGLAYKDDVYQLFFAFDPNEKIMNSLIYK